MKSKSENNLFLLYPNIAKEWHPTKNGELTPGDVTPGSNKKVWWVCKYGHEWESVVAKRTQRNQGCPYCGGHRVTDTNNVAFLYPQLIEWWDKEKNINCTLFNYTKGSNKKAWWICPKGHSFSQTITQRVRGKQCPICCGQIVTSDNCLAKINPQLAKEWDVSKNGELTPRDVTAGSSKKVWWICKYGHEWEATISFRNKGTGCPICSSEKQTSFPEQAILFYVTKMTKSYGRYNIGGFEADIYCPELKLAIEYDGEFFHKGKKNTERENKKNEYFLINEIKLVRVKDTKQKNILNVSYTDYGLLIRVSYNQDYDFINFIIEEILNYVNKLYNTNYKIDIDIVRDKVEILKQYSKEKEERSFVATKPIGAKKWDYEKNGNIKLEFLPMTSKKKFYWKCPTCNYQWYGTLDGITNALTCNRCSRQVKSEYPIAKEIESSNVNFKEVAHNLQKENPILASQWHPIKNGNFKPCNVTSKSGKRVWWLCPICRYEWTQIVKTRNNGSGARNCPKCANNQHQKTNNVLTFNEKLVEEFDENKNYPKRLTDFTPGSNVKVWWKCSDCGIEYLYSIKLRKNGGGCPQCAYENRRKSKFKKIINIEKNIVFSSTIEASNISNISRTSITSCLNGKSKTAGGFHWKFYENNDDYLVVVGNGFDLNEGLKTSYTDFKKYLFSTNQCLYDEIEFFYCSIFRNSENKLVDLDKSILISNDKWFYNNNLFLWSDLETNIANVSYESIGRYYGFGKFEIDNKQVDNLNLRFKDLFDSLKLAILKWVRTIDTNSLLKKHFIGNPLFINFNYTKTLENRYFIDVDNICYIHGNLDNDNIVFGTNNKSIEDFKEYKFKHVYKAFYIRELEKILIKNCKPTEKIINNKLLPSLKCKKINKVVVLGCSISKIDENYFDKLIELYPNICWEISYYTNEDFYRLNTYFANKNIKFELKKITELLKKYTIE